MREQTKQTVLKAIKDHPAVVKAAITGSFARRTDVDAFSDLDVLVVARDIGAISDVRAWLPGSAEVLMYAFHLSNYCTVLLSDLQKIDLAIFSVDDPPSRWVVHDYEILKDSDGFGEQLAEAAKTTRESAAPHLNSDVTIDNVLLLLVTASHRNARGELLSAHGFLTMACDMVIALETRQRGVHATADLLDPRRRIERLRPALAATMHECLFALPGNGITRLARYLTSAYRLEIADGQMKVLDHLSVA